MKLPRDLSGSDLAAALGRVGYRVVRQSGSHVRLTRDEAEQHHVTIPAHDVLKIGTLAAILNDVSVHLKLDRDDLLKRLFG
jgi:predicted RNA binding protein YcfA (HicA-like mRNA interferase family)